MATNVLVSEFLQFLEDIPFGSLAAAISAGGANIPLDAAAAEAILQAAAKDFFGGKTATSAAASVASAAGVPGAAAAIG